VRRFVARYGWRAYALPVLVVATVAVLAQMIVDGRVTAATQPAADRARTSALQTNAPLTSAPATPPTIVLGQLRDSTACRGNTDRTLVVVSISLQHVWMCQGRSQVDSSAATTGAVNRENVTPTGSWRVQAKQTNRYLVGPGYRDFVHYWIPFDGDFGFHDASWQTMPFGAQGYRTRGSNGCVHLPMPVMSWLYRWVRVGQTVVAVQA
jgi:lipoprotein-anchoring transpeptidase ErfK/SrfK